MTAREQEQKTFARPVRLGGCPDQDRLDVAPSPAIDAVLTMCAGLLSIPLLRGRWRPKDARRDEAGHEALVQAELAKLSASP